LRRAIAARPLDCGCEHVLYGIMLQNVGRYVDSIAEFRRGTEMLPLDAASQFVLADALTAIGRHDEAKPHFDATAELAADAPAGLPNLVVEATETGNYAAGIEALGSSGVPMPQPFRAALLGGFHAMATGDAGEKARAIRALNALPDDQKSYMVAKLLAVLGAPHDAFQLFVDGIGSRYDWPSLLWYPSMRGVLWDPGFPAVAQRLGLTNYWRATRTRPDVCSAQGPPPFCKTI
jgi:tetratricopeptide (TPR) repeat protein